MIKRLFVQLTLWFAFMAVLLFGAAGTISWSAGWCFLFVWAVPGVWLGLWLARYDPGLLAERLRPVMQPQQHLWDRLFIVYIGAAWVGWMIVMPLDAARFHWSHMPVWLEPVGALAILVCTYLCFLVFRANSFAAAVVKIQAERGHKVIDTGPYAWVRHPMYGATLLFFIGTPLMLGSWWGVVCMPLLVGGIGYRAVQEERMLAAQLEGYAAYAGRVRYRFVPYIW